MLREERCAVGWGRFQRTTGSDLDTRGGVSTAAASAPTTGVQDPWAQFSATAGSAPAPAPAPTDAPAGQNFYYGTPGKGSGDNKVEGEWKLYDEKYIMPPALATHKYDHAKPLEWLQSARDYMAGRTEEIDGLLDWVEQRTEPIGAPAGDICCACNIVCGLVP